jgi:uncharacterized membrane protein
MNWLRGIFSSTSEVSSMRVMTMLALLTGCFVGIVGIYKDRNLAELSILCGTFLSAAMTGKIMQKNIENKTN